MNMNDTNAKERMILELFEIRAIDFGKFKLKSGLISPYYMDLRLLVSFPHLLQMVADVIWERLRLLTFDLIVGVPYTALPIATAISLKHNRPLIFVRKEKKEYGKGNMIEGIFHPGQHVLIIDDVIADGESKLETVKPLQEKGLVVNDIVVLVDRGQGGSERIKELGYRCHTITAMDEILEVLLKHSRISKEQYRECVEFMNETRKKPTKAITRKHPAVKTAS